MAPIAVDPSPKFHSLLRIEPSGSELAVESKVHARALQLCEKAAVGATLVAATGCTTMDQSTPRLLAMPGVVAVRPPAVPAASEPVSAAAAVTWPERVPTLWLRSATPAGRVHPVLSDDLSAQYDTSVLPAVATGTTGVVREVLLVVSKATAWDDTPAASE